MKIPKNPVNDIPQVRANNTKSRNNLSIGEVLQAYKSKQSDIGEVLQAYRKRESSFSDIFQSMNTHANEEIAQLATKITHHTTTYTYHPDPSQRTTKTETVGCKMEAYLDPAQSINGSGPGSDQTELMQSLKQRYGKPLTSSCFVKGHLLNDNLGGFGVKENLFPLTSSANGFHKNRVENFVKECLYSPMISKRKRGLYYEVEVDSKFDDTKAGDKFKCKLQECDPTTHVKALPLLGYIEIHSDLSAGSGSATIDDKVGFPTKDIPASWLSTGEGRRKDFEAHKTAGKIAVQ